MSNQNWIPSQEQAYMDLCNDWGIILSNEANRIRFGWNDQESNAVCDIISTYLDARAEYKRDDSTTNKITRDRTRKEAVKVMRKFANTSVRFNDKMTEEVLSKLGIKLRDKTRTPVGEPVGKAIPEFILTDPYQLTVRIKHIEGTVADPRANYGCRIYYGVYNAGDTPPATGKELRESVFTRQKRELFEFEPEDRGKTAWFCIRYENSRGKAGQWGPLGSAIIP
jgi:hypothetical protein